MLGKIIIAGGSGFLGVSLAGHLATAGHSIVILSRHAPKPSGPWRHIRWDARSLGAWRDELEGATGLINLAGRSVDCIKTPDHQDEILRSRVEATRVLGLAVRAVDSPPPAWVQMSTAHIYGDPPHVVCDEDSAFGSGFAPFVGRAWEDEFHASVLPCQRPVVLRTSFVIGRDRGAGGGALARLRTLVKLGLGGRVGAGTQGVSWIHETDLNRLFELSLVDSTTRGVYVATSPNPVPQHVFMRELRRALRVPIGLPASSWMARIGAPLFMRTDPELALYGRYVVSKRLAAEGFEFRFPDLRAALNDLMADPAPVFSAQRQRSVAVGVSLKFSRLFFACVRGELR
ncbi:MAG TPA: DUF1731 domain-containing protein [Pirellulales bacterium]|jgi:hypothetical protein|nr:DUF1731 domain-containing protein [Pirellulales bacterium]